MTYQKKKEIYEKWMAGAPYQRNRRLAEEHRLSTVTIGQIVEEMQHPGQHRKLIWVDVVL